MSNIVNDGSVQYGSRNLTIDGVVYATDDFSWNEETGSEIIRTAASGALSGRVSIKGALTGSATLQLADESTALPAWGAQFTVTEGVCTVTAVGRTETKDGETKVPISFVKNITADIVVS